KVAWKQSSAAWGSASRRRQTPRTSGPWRRTRAVKAAWSRWMAKRCTSSSSGVAAARWAAARRRRQRAVGLVGTGGTSVAPAWARPSWPGKRYGGGMAGLVHFFSGGAILAEKRPAAQEQGARGGRGRRSAVFDPPRQPGTAEHQSHRTPWFRPFFEERFVL